MAKLLVYKGPYRPNLEIRFPTPSDINHSFMKTSRMVILMVYISSKEVYLTYAIVIVTRKGQEKHGGECTKVSKG